MSQPAKKRPVPPSAATDEVRDQEGSGRFVIEAARPSETMLPPTSPAAEGTQLEALPLLELEPEALEEIPATRGIVSGVFANRGATPSEERDDELENAVASMHAYYRDSERQQHERAQLVIEDHSLLPGNPYGASSLVPPARKPLALGKVLGVAALAVALGTGAWFVQRETSGVRSASVQAAPKVAVAAVEQAPVVAQPVVETAQPKVEQPAQSAPVAVAATPTAEREVALAPAADVRVPSARKTLVGSEAREGARPVVAAPAHEAEHDATAQAALRAVLAGSTPESATASTTRETTAPSATPVEVAPVAAAPADTTADTMGALPDLPSREDVVTGFESVRDELSKCAAGKHGTVKIDTTIANSGRVSKALIDGTFKGTPEGSCMARAARAARFPQFGRSSLSVSYPIAL